MKTILWYRGARTHKSHAVKNDGKGQWPSLCGRMTVTGSGTETPIHGTSIKPKNACRDCEKRLAK